MKFPHQIWKLRAFAMAALFFLVTPQSVSAHGELDIQIAAVTKKIQTATNNIAQLYLDRAELHREHQDWEAAKSDYDHAAELDPKLAAVDFFRAKMLDDSGQLEAAHKMFDQVINRSPNDGEAFIGRARVLVKLNQPEPAIADFRRGIAFSEKPKPEYYLELAQTFANEGNPNDAVQTLDEGIKKFGAIVMLQGYALDLELERKNPHAALARIETIIKDAPRKENWLARRGDILLAAGLPDEARKSFEESLAAIKILPTILQKAPPLQNLQARINASLAKITNAPLNAKNEN